jgi:hypothetical protein
LRQVDGFSDKDAEKIMAARDRPFTSVRDFWLRTGNYRAWQVSQAVVLRTREGRATALPGDWVVEGARGERWPVTDDQFRRSYAAPAGLPPTGAHTAANTQAPDTQAPNTHGAYAHGAQRPAANSPAADPAPAHPPAVPPPRRQPPDQTAIRNP